MAKKSDSYDKALDIILHEKVVSVGEGDDKYRLKIRVRAYNGGTPKITVEHVNPGKQDGFRLKGFSAEEFNAAAEAMADCAQWMLSQATEAPAVETKSKGKKAA